MAPPVYPNIATYVVHIIIMLYASFCRYTGKLYAANEALPAKMNVRFPLSEIIIIHLLVTIISIVIMIINMIVRFPLRQILLIVHFYPQPNHYPPPLHDQQRHDHHDHDHRPDPIGAASFVVLDTDYTSYGLICTCQEIDLFITTVNCMMMMRQYLLFIH